MGRKRAGDLKGKHVQGQMFELKWRLGKNTCIKCTIRLQSGLMLLTAAAHEAAAAGGVCMTRDGSTECFMCSGGGG